MPHESRTSSNSLDPSCIRSDDDSGAGCAAGQARAMWGAGNPGDTRLKNPVSTEDREALKRLVEAGRMIRRSDGRYGSAAKAMMTQANAQRLKARELAVSGFDKQKTMYPSDKGRRLYAEMKSNAK
jgi:hypothetical protein